MDNKSSSKVLLALTALSVLLPTPALGITNCLQQAGTVATSGCSMCYQSAPNLMGSCEPYLYDPGCDFATLSGVVPSCFKCKPNYYQPSPFAKCQPVTNGITNCLRHRDKTAADPDCWVCNAKIPASNLKSCDSFATVPSGEQTYVANCAQGYRAGAGTSAKCWACNNGFALESSTDKCASTTTTGCWKQANGKCTACRAWDGYFTDGFDTSVSGNPVVCRTLNDQTPWITRGVAKDSGTQVTGLTNQSRIDIYDQATYSQTAITQYVDLKDGYIAMNDTVKNFAVSKASGTGFDMIKAFNFGLKEIPWYKRKDTYTYSTRTWQLFRCFFEKKMCLIVNDSYTTNPTSGRGEFDHQGIFAFNVSNPLQNGVIFKNNETMQGKYISSVLSITKSNYIIIGFRTRNPWTATSPKVLLRLDYTDTKKQFEYSIPDTSAIIDCYKLIYAEYSKFFIASFDKNNGVLIYDITKTTQVPQRIFRPEKANFEQIAYLEKSKVVLMAQNYEKKIYGYSLLGKDLYHISTSGKVTALKALKASDYFLMWELTVNKAATIYNLQGIVHKITLESSLYENRLFDSQYFGGLLQTNSEVPVVLLRYSWNAGSNNPSCLSSAAATPKYSFTNKWCGNSCSSGATFTIRGLCEFTNDPTFRVYVSTNPPADLATNKVGEDLQITVKTAVDPNNPNSDPNNPNGNPNTDPNSANNGANSSSSSSKGGFLSTTVIIIIGIVVVGLILSAVAIGVIIYCMMKPSPRVRKVTHRTAL